MKRLKTILPLTLGVTLASGVSVGANEACQLQSPSGQIKHVVDITFDKCIYAATIQMSHLTSSTYPIC